MPEGANDAKLASLEQAVQRKLIRFALIEGAVVLFVLLPGLLRLFVYNDDLSPQQTNTYLVALLVGYAVVAGVLTWKFILVPARQLADYKAGYKAGRRTPTVV